MGEDPDTARQVLPWALDNADLIGLGLIALMVVLVVWRAATRQPVSGAEALIGVVGLIALTLPLLSNISLEGFGVKFSATVQSLENTSGDIAKQLGVLNQQQLQNRERIEALNETLTAIAAASGIGGPTASGSPDAGEPDAVLAPLRMDAVPEKAFSILIFYRQAQRERAQSLAQTLLSRGYYASATLTDLVEAADKGAPGEIRMLYTRHGEQAAEDIRAVIAQRFGDEDLLWRDDPVRLVNGDVQIQFF